MLLLVFDTPEESNKFLKIYNVYGKTIYYTIKRFISNEYLIEDISQEVFIWLARHLDKINLDNPVQARNYIIIATRNYCKNYLRDSKKIPEDPLDTILPLYIELDEVLSKIIHKANYSLIVSCISDINSISGTLTLYKQDSSGNYEKKSSKNVHCSGNYMNPDSSFSSYGSGNYLLVFDGKVTGNNISESITISAKNSY